MEVEIMEAKVKEMTEFNLPPRPPLPPKPPGLQPPAAQPQVTDFVKTVEAAPASKAATKPVRKGRSNRTIMPVAISSILSFLVITAFLGSQVASGQDPKLGSKQAAKVEPQQVLIKKKIVTRKIVKMVPAPVQSAGSSSGQGYSASSQAYSAPSQTYSAPAQTYSAPVQSAPAPAPVQTATS